MRRTAIVVGVCALSSSGCTEAQPSASMSSLPPSVREALLALCAPCEFADYGAAWNPSDFLDGRPRRRLVKIEGTASGWLIEYEHGGRGRHTHTVVFELEPRIHVAQGSDCIPSAEVRCEW